MHDRSEVWRTPHIEVASVKLWTSILESFNLRSSLAGLFFLFFLFFPLTPLLAILTHWIHFIENGWSSTLALLASSLSHHLNSPLGVALPQSSIFDLPLISLGFLALWAIRAQEFSTSSPPFSFSRKFSPPSRPRVPEVPSPRIVASPL